MENIKGPIESIGQRGVMVKGVGKTAYDIFINGVKFSAFDLQGTQMGDIVEVEYYKNGVYNNITKISKVTGQTTIPMVSPEVMPEKTNRNEIAIVGLAKSFIEANPDILPEQAANKAIETYDFIKKKL